MNVHRINRPLSSNLLFVWDGTDNFIASAERFVRILQGRGVYSIHAMPHESIYNYGSVGCESQVKPRAAERLEAEFRRQVRGHMRLSDSSFELLFGDRVNEIAILAAQLQAKAILMPGFEQSTFSKWIHGDLNEKLRTKATCPVILLDSKPTQTKRRYGDVSSGFHQEHS